MGRRHAGPFAILEGPMTASRLPPPIGAPPILEPLTAVALRAARAALYAVFVVIPVIQARLLQPVQLERARAADRLRRAGELPARAVATRCSTARSPHNVFFVMLSLVIQIPFALGLALLLNRRFRGRACAG